MKRLLILALAAGLIFAMADMSMAAWPSDPGSIPAGAAANGIGASRHNLGAFSTHITTPNTTEICIFCHTPHHAGTDGPLWNRGYGSGYTAYGTTVAGTNIQDSDIGGATLACLSCHDGTVQFDVLVNAPGKANGGLAIGATDLGWTFTDEGTPINDLSGSGRLNIGTDLTNDHPVSVVYHSDRASLRPTNTVIASIDLTSGLASSASSDTNLSQNRWAINGYIDNGSATIGDLLRNGKVECSSCHDPHFDNKSWTEAEDTWGGEAHSDGLFLRRVGGNTGSGVCRTCHNK